MMAKDKEDKKDASGKTDAAKTGGKAMGLFTWIILGSVVAAGATGGFALSQLMGGQDAPPPPPSAEAVEAKKAADAFNQLAAQTAPGTTPWTYDAMEPVLANLDEPGVTRYVRVTISLELSPEMDPVKGKEFLDQRVMVLRDLLTTYFSGLSIEDVRGSRNLNRIKRDVQDQFNTLLFPDAKPFIRQILFREFAVQ